MRRQSLVSMMVALLAVACTPNPPAQVGGADVFREIQIDRGVIQLGMPLPAAVPTPPAGDTVVSLPAQLIGGAEAIRVHLSANGVVRMLWFEYSTGSDYDAMVAEYVGLLGEPRKEPFRRGERAIWEDARTRFELVRDPERSAGTVYGILGDRAGID